MPILPGNIGDVRVGFGLWKSHWAAALVEAALLVAGAYFYWRAASETERSAGAAPRQANLVAGLILLSGIVVLGVDVFLG
jgi:hypothetical protein